MSNRVDSSSDLPARWPKPAFLSLILPLAIVLGTPLPAQGDERTGKDVVDETCAACHATGAGGAPKIGDDAAWSVRATQGLAGLTANALEGIRKMPAHGGRPDLSDLEIARAITYMVNRSGGNWIEPVSEDELTAERTGEQVVTAKCVECHGEGVGGAPRIGDLQAWVPRMALGLNHLVRSAIRGHGGMPPRGGQANLTDTEIRAAILYMYYPAGASADPKAKVAKPASKAGSDPNHLFVEGTEIYLGFLPTQMLRALPLGSPERAMHGGIPTGSGYYHVNVSLLDEESGTPVADARVGMQLRGRGLMPVEVALEPMVIGAGSYGNYIRPMPSASYTITLQIRRPGAARTIEARFEHWFE